MLAAWHVKPVIGIVTLPERDVACGLQDVVWSQARVWRCGRENGRNRVTAWNMHPQYHCNMHLYIRCVWKIC